MKQYAFIWYLLLTATLQSFHSRSTPKSSLTPTSKPQINNKNSSHWINILPLPSCFSPDQIRLFYLSSLALDKHSWVPLASGTKLLQTPTYIVRARVSTPPPTMRMALDINNDLCWIPSSSCSGCPKSTSATTLLNITASLLETTRILELNVSSISISNTTNLDLSQLAFFITTRDTWLHVLNQIQDLDITCVLQSDLIKLVFSFDHLATDNPSSFSNVFHIADLGQYTLLFARCMPQLQVSMVINFTVGVLARDSLFQEAPYILEKMTYSKLIPGITTYLTIISMWRMSRKIDKASMVFRRLKSSTVEIGCVLNRIVMFVYEMLDLKRRQESIVKKLANSVDKKDHSLILRSKLGLGYLENRDVEMETFVSYLMNLFQDIMLAMEKKVEFSRNLVGKDSTVNAILNLQKKIKYMPLVRNNMSIMYPHQTSPSMLALSSENTFSNTILFIDVNYTQVVDNLHNPSAIFGLIISTSTPNYDIYLFLTTARVKLYYLNLQTQKPFSDTHIKFLFTTLEIFVSSITNEKTTISRLSTTIAISFPKTTIVAIIVDNEILFNNIDTSMFIIPTSVIVAIIRSSLHSCLFAINHILVHFLFGKLNFAPHKSISISLYTFTFSSLIAQPNDNLHHVISHHSQNANVGVLSFPHIDIILTFKITFDTTSFFFTCDKYNPVFTVRSIYDLEDKVDFESVAMIRLLDQ